MWVKVGYSGRSAEETVRVLRVDAVHFVARHRQGGLTVVHLVGSEVAIYSCPRFRGPSMALAETA